MKPSHRAEGGLQIQDCVYVLPTFSKSISLEVTRGSKDEARKRWNQMFHSQIGSAAIAKESARASNAEVERDVVRHEAVRGVGDEAFWAPESPSGALYVLRKKAFLRISIGGPDPPNVKLQRAKALARKALRKL